MSYEDRQCDERFQVESVEDFFADKTPDEIYIIRKYMVPCENCGELCSKNNPTIKATGYCAMCDASDDLAEARGSSPNASHNASFLAQIVKEWKELANQ